MKKVTTADRLKEIMCTRKLRQVDILEKCAPYCKKYGVSLQKNALSEYVNGKTEPGQSKLTILGLALNVNEVWLMGYDVPKERDNSANTQQPADEQELLNDYRSLNDLGKNEAKKRVNELTKLEQYTGGSDSDSDDEEGDTVLIAARKGGAPQKLKMKKRDPNKSILDVPDYGGGRY